MLNVGTEFRKGILFVRLEGILNRRSSYKLNNYLVPVILKHKINTLYIICIYLKIHKYKR